MISLDANVHTQVMDERVAFLMSNILKESLKRIKNLFESNLKNIFPELNLDFS